MSISTDFGVRALSARDSIASPTTAPQANAAAGLIDAESCAVAEESSAGRFDEETVVRMRRALERLRPDERVLVALFYEEERSLAEIAQIMNLTLSNVKVRLHRLRGRLRHYMEE